MAIASNMLACTPPKFEPTWTCFDGCHEIIVGRRKIIGARRETTVVVARVLVHIATLANIIEAVVTYADAAKVVTRFAIARRVDVAAIIESLHGMA